jgi:4-carboxymuconolactone decarboxylase
MPDGRVGIVTTDPQPSGTTDPSYAAALDTAEQLLGFRLERFLGDGPGEPANGADFKRIATVHAFGDVWPRTEHLDVRTRALVSVTIAATLGVLEPLAFDGYQVAAQVFAENPER